MKPLGARIEKKYIHDGFLHVVGCDEVGRGALAGPLVAAAVCFDFKTVSRKDEWFKKINDSKLLTPAVRDGLAFHIKQRAYAWSVVSVPPSVIDRIGIHLANIRALHEALLRLHVVYSISPNRSMSVIDGRFEIPNWEGSQRAVVGGDGKIVSIAAASVLAKVHRDKYMMKQDTRFPGYYFRRHKGYGTRMHLEAISRRGQSSIHRKTFCRTIDGAAPSEV